MVSLPKPEFIGLKFPRLTKMNFSLYYWKDQDTDRGWSRDPGPSDGGEFPRFFYREYPMKELSVFIGESGDFSE